METTCERQQIKPGVLSMHADNGPSMTSQLVASLLIALDVVNSHSRPYVSDDNPFSEAQFKTLKYRPDFPERFASLQHAREFLRAFFVWYNTEHHHSGLALLTPTPFKVIFPWISWNLANEPSNCGHGRLGRERSPCAVPSWG